MRPRDRVARIDSTFDMIQLERVASISTRDATDRQQIHPMVSVPHSSSNPTRHVFFPNGFIHVRRINKAMMNAFRFSCTQMPAMWDQQRKVHVNTGHFAPGRLVPYNSIHSTGYTWSRDVDRDWVRARRAATPCARALVWPASECQPALEVRMHPRLKVGHPRK